MPGARVSLPRRAIGAVTHSDTSSASAAASAATMAQAMISRRCARSASGVSVSTGLLTVSTPISAAARRTGAATCSTAVRGSAGSAQVARAP